MRSVIKQLATINSTIYKVRKTTHNSDMKEHDSRIPTSNTMDK